MKVILVKKKCVKKFKFSKFFNEKIEEDSNNFWHKKLTLKVRNWHFSIAWFRVDIDLTKKDLWKSAMLHSLIDEIFLNVIYILLT